MGEVVDFYSGLTYHPQDVRNKGCLVIRSSNIQDGAIVLKDNVFVNKNIVNSDNVLPGDIVVVVRNCIL